MKEKLQNCAWNLVFCAFISPIVWNMCENIHYESVYFKELIHNEQEYYWPTIYRTGAAVVVTVTSISFLYRHVFPTFHMFDVSISRKCCVATLLLKWWKQQRKIKQLMGRWSFPSPDDLVRKTLSGVLKWFYSQMFDTSVLKGIKISQWK